MFELTFWFENNLIFFFCNEENSNFKSEITQRLSGFGLRYLDPGNLLTP